MRVHFGPGYRIYFAKQDRAVVVLLCGGEKKSQRADIQTAKAYWTDYRRLVPGA
jgi:putative addiction module killer protein